MSKASKDTWFVSGGQKRRDTKYAAGEESEKRHPLNEHQNAEDGQSFLTSNRLCEMNKAMGLAQIYEDINLGGGQVTPNTT